VTDPSGETFGNYAKRDTKSSESYAVGMWRFVATAFSLTVKSMGTTAVALGAGLLVFLASIGLKYKHEGWTAVKASLAGDAGLGVGIAAVVWFLLFVFCLGRAREMRASSGDSHYEVLDSAFSEIKRAIRGLQPRRITDEQHRIIATVCDAWPAYRQVPHERRVNVLATSKADDAMSYARQLRRAINDGAIYSDEVLDYDFGTVLEPTEQWRRDNEKFLSFHENNVTIFGSDHEQHDGNPMHEVLVEALQRAGVPVTAYVDVNQIGGMIAVIVGRGNK